MKCVWFFFVYPALLGLGLLLGCNRHPYQDQWERREEIRAEVKAAYQPRSRPLESVEERLDRIEQLLAAVQLSVSDENLADVYHLLIDIRNDVKLRGQSPAVQIDEGDGPVDANVDERAK